VRKLTILLILSVLSFGIAAQADVVVTNSSAGWVQISANTFGLPADLTSIGCGAENETTCEPMGVFNFNVGFQTSGVLNILNETGIEISDQLHYFNDASGLGVLTFKSDPSLDNLLPDGVPLCVEVPGQGCVMPFTILATDGSVITLTAASDSESVFDPFGLGADSSDELQVTGGATIAPEPGAMMLFGTGLIGVAGAIRRRFMR